MATGLSLDKVNSLLPLLFKIEADIKLAVTQWPLFVKSRPTSKKVPSAKVLKFESDIVGALLVTSVIKSLLIKSFPTAKIPKNVTPDYVLTPGDKSGIVLLIGVFSVRNNLMFLLDVLANHKVSPTTSKAVQADTDLIVQTYIKPYL